MNRSMFLVENNVPDVYVNESRDFQLVSRLYDLVFQSTRFSIDSMDYISDINKCNDSLLDLIGSKVGFFSSLKLTDSTYRKVLAAFPHIMRHKGSKEGIQLILNLFMHITNAKLTMKETSDPSIITIVFHDYMLNVDLLKALIEYIRPTGLIIAYEFLTHIDSGADYLLTDSVRFGTVMNYIDLDEDELAGVVVDTINTPSTHSYDSDIANNVGFTVLSKTDDRELNK